MGQIDIFFHNNADWHFNSSNQLKRTNTQNTSHNDGNSLERPAIVERRRYVTVNFFLPTYSAANKLLKKDIICFRPTTNLNISGAEAMESKLLYNSINRRPTKFDLIKGLNSSETGCAMPDYYPSPCPRSRLLTSWDVGLFRHRG